jgi:hypothetical protein
MDNRHDASGSPYSPKIARAPLPTKTFFEKTNPRIDPIRAKTTTYGINCPFQRFSITHNRAIWNPKSAPITLGYQD